MVSCDQPPSSEFYEEKPTLIIEVLSPSTKTRDRLEKLVAYTRIPTLKEYFTVAQDRVEVFRYTSVNGEMVLTQYQEGDSVEFSSIGLLLPIKEIYEGAL